MEMIMNIFHALYSFIGILAGAYIKTVERLFGMHPVFEYHEGLAAWTAWIIIVLIGFICIRRAKAEKHGGIR